jgi:ribosomal protein S18 acetylase RimI-like enzyme
MIRRAEAQDHPWIVATGAEAYADLGDYTRILPSWLEQPGVLAWIDHDVQGRGRGFAMLGFYTEDTAKTGTSAAAVAALAAASPDGIHRQQVIADLLALAVLPAFQRRGIGSKLLDHVIDVAERVAPASRITQLRLTVAENNTGAQRLYARTGFTVVDGAATYDRGQRALRMVRPLGSARAATR